MARPDYQGATWHGAHANNYSAASRPGSNPIDKVVIHVTQGSWSSAINWFNDSRAYVSAHYTVRSSDGHIGQSVEEKDIGYHAGNWTYNQTSIGIEHEGFVSDPSWFTDAMYRSSARLTAYLCEKYRIPVDRQRIIGHSEVPNATHTDPGRYWDWTKYIDLVREFSGTRYSQVVDNATTGRFSAPRSWKYSSWSSQKYGQDYAYNTPKAVSESAAFKVKIPETADYQVSAWWPANSGYNNSAPIGVRTTSGIKWTRVDQRKTGGRWVSLGTFNMAAGDRNSVFVSRWTRGTGYVIADAVRVVRA